MSKSIHRKTIERSNLLVLLSHRLHTCYTSWFRATAPNHQITMLSQNRANAFILRALATASALDLFSLQYFLLPLEADLRAKDRSAKRRAHKAYVRPFDARTNGRRSMSSAALSHAKASSVPFEVSARSLLFSTLRLILPTFLSWCKRMYLTSNLCHRRATFKGSLHRARRESLSINLERRVFKFTIPSPTRLIFRVAKRTKSLAIASHPARVLLLAAKIGTKESAEKSTHCDPLGPSQSSSQIWLL